MDVGVVGTGYVGLVVGACLAEYGNDVVCADIDAEKIERLRSGEPTIHEPGLEELLLRNLEAGRLTFTTSVATAARSSDVVFLAVGTPPADDGSADLTGVLAAARSVVAHASPGTLLVVKSTVPVGTVERIQDLARRASADAVEVCSNPEFLREGSAVQDFLSPDRVVVGARSREARATLRTLYEAFVPDGTPILFMDPASAQITKYAANTMLAMRISFMNLMARFCEEAGADVEAVRAGVGSDHRIGGAFLRAGCGYGGSCFPKDVRALARSLEERGLEPGLVAEVEGINETQKRILVERARTRLGSLEGRRCALWGLSFKPETDDMRGAPSLVVADVLADAGADVVAHDPRAMPEAAHLLDPRVRYVDDPWDAVDGADALFVLTEWEAYRDPDLHRLRDLMRIPLVLDGRNLYDAARLAAAGVEHRGVGRPRARLRAVDDRAGAPEALRTAAAD